MQPLKTQTQAALEWLLAGDTGTSSKCICRVLTGSPTPEESAWHDGDTPADVSDFGRCYRLLQKIPAWTSRLPEVAARYPKWGPMVAVWDELAAAYAQGLEAYGGHSSRFARHRPNPVWDKLYERIEQLNDEGMAAAGWERHAGGWSKA